MTDAVMTVHDTVEVAGAQYDTVTTLGSTTNLMMPSSSMVSIVMQ